MNSLLQTKPKTPTAAPKPPPPSVEDAIREAQLLASALLDRKASREARERELQDLVHLSGGASALVNLDAISADVVKLTVALDIEERAIAGAESRLKVLLPVIDADTGRMQSLLAEIIREIESTALAESLRDLRPFFRPEVLPGVAARSTKMSLAAAFTQEHRGAGGGVSHVMDGRGGTEIAPGTSPFAILSAHRSVERSLDVARARLLEMKQRGTFESA